MLQFNRFNATARFSYFSRFWLIMSTDRKLDTIVVASNYKKLSGKRLEITENQPKPTGTEWTGNGQISTETEWISTGCNQISIKINWMAESENDLISRVEKHVVWIHFYKLSIWYSFIFWKSIYILTRLEYLVEWIQKLYHNIVSFEFDWDNV